MLIPTNHLRATFLRRLKTQERAYEKFGIFYTPRFFTKAVKQDADAKKELERIYGKLLDDIEIPLCNGTTTTLAKIEGLLIHNKTVSALCNIDNTQRQILLKDFDLKENHLKHVSLDHSVSFHDVIKKLAPNLNEIKLLTQKIRNKKVMKKEDMRKQYAKLVKDYQGQTLKNLLQEVDYLASHTKLRLMPSHKNFSKGKRME